MSRVEVRPRAAAAFGLPAGSRFPPGAWVVCEAGELRIQADGQVEPRPTPWPWSRPSVAAIPTVRP